MDYTLLALASIVIVGVGMQWLAWRVHMPSIFLLLLAGFVLGSVTGWLDPDRLLGEALFPMISLAVAIILFEGGLSLDIAELRKIGHVVRRLITVGTLVTWVGVAVLANTLLDFSVGLSILLGAVLVVTGPTVIIPLLRQIRPTANVASAVRWEGIVNDPIGAILAVLVFDVIITGGAQPSVGPAVLNISKALLAGGGLGLLGAWLVVVLLERYWVPDFLQSPMTLAVVIAAFTLSDLILPEAGLLTVTVMGSALASQKRVPVRPIMQFKENLRVVLISGLFVVLAARLPIQDPVYSDLGSIIFVVALILVIRPASIAVATIGTLLNWRERVFMAWMAPRGIVAAAVASVLALDLAEHGVPGADRFASVVFMVIVATVAVYGLTAGVMARWLRVATSKRKGVLLVGASPWVRALARVLANNKIEVLLVDSNWGNVAAARQQGLNAYYGNILAEHLTDELALDGIGRMLALTPNHEVNALTSLHLRETFGRANVFQLAPERATQGQASGALPQHLQGRYLFSANVTWSEIDGRFGRGAVIKQTGLTEEFDYEAFQQFYGQTSLPLFSVSPSGDVVVIAAGSDFAPTPRQDLISLVEEPPSTESTSPVD